MTDSSPALGTKDGSRKTEPAKTLSHSWPGLAAFDMDGTLIQGRLVFALSEALGNADKVMAIQASSIPGYEKTKAIASLFADLSRKDIESAVESIPLVKNSEAVIRQLREQGCKVGIISDSYTIALQSVAARLGGMDFITANYLEFRQGKTTGAVRMPLGWEKIGCFCKISVCKRYHLEKYSRQFGIPVRNTLAVGDTMSDACMVAAAGVGVAFMPKDSKIAKATKNVVEQPDLAKVLEFRF